MQYAVGSRQIEVINRQFSFKPVAAGEANPLCSMRLPNYSYSYSYSYSYLGARANTSSEHRTVSGFASLRLRVKRQLSTRHFGLRTAICRLPSASMPPQVGVLAKKHLIWLE